MAEKIIKSFERYKSGSFSIALDKPIVTIEENRQFLKELNDIWKKEKRKRRGERNKKIRKNEKNNSVNSK